MVKADSISRLHDTLLIQILLLLPLPDAQRTRVLSKRWKNMRAFLHVLHLVMPFCWTAEEINRFHDLVDQALDLRGNMPIQRFYLYCSKNCSYDSVSGWLRKVVQCKMKEIIIDNQETVSPEQFELIRYLLNSADKLESLTMNARIINTKMREQVLNLHRSSKSCRIQFV